MRDLALHETLHISEELATKLRSAGLGWRPRLHDLFLIPDRNLDGRVFALSDMTVDMEHLAGHSTIMFNGAVEWSLDYIISDEVLWLPTEGQLRELLGEALVSLTTVPDGYRCTAMVDGVARSFEDDKAAEAYGRALLAVLEADPA